MKISGANKGKIRSANVRKRISESLKGRKHTEETKRKMSESGGNMIGYKHTAETKKKMSESHKGRSSWNKGKKSQKWSDATKLWWKNRKKAEMLKKLNIKTEGKLNERH